MATQIIPGQRSWSMTRDGEGHREYKIRHRIRCSTSDGPANALQTPGLPLPGAWWIVDADLDLWAWCRGDATVTPVLENEPNRHFDVEQTFSTKPPGKDQGGKQTGEECSTGNQDPLLEPQKISGSYVKYQEEQHFDRFGQPILTSSFEIPRSDAITFDRGRPQIKIEQNVASLEAALCYSMVDTVNDAPLWGLPARCVKLSNFTFSRLFYGQCYIYYTRSFEFDIRYETFDKDVLDEGTKALWGHWSTNGRWVLDPVGIDEFAEYFYGDPLNPSDFGRFKDRAGENARVLLNGAGLPALSTVGSGTGVDTGEPAAIHVEYYRESDFLLLGIPVTF